MNLPSSEYLPHLSYDSVVFGFSGEKLKILILEYHELGLFALPGGFVRRDESLDQAVKRGLSERTGLEDIFLEQFHTFGAVDRNKPALIRQIMQNRGVDLQEGWLLDRFITVGYYALIDYEKVSPTPDSYSDSIKWYDYDDLPELMMDHREIVDQALIHLRTHLDQKLLSFNLLPARFTMKELQQVYEEVLNERLNRANFQRKMLNLNILERHNKLFTGGSHKAPYLYSFKPKS